MSQGIGFQPCPCTKDIMTKVEDLVTAKEGIGLRQDTANFFPTTSC